MAKICVMYSGHQSSSAHLDNLRRIFDSESVAQVFSEDDVFANAHDAEVVLGHRFLRQTLGISNSIKWVQTSGSGWDHLPWREMKARGIALSRSTFASSHIAQHAVALGFSLYRKIPEIVDAQNRNVWNTSLQTSVLPTLKNALIVGFGEIGRAIGSILLAAGIHVFSCSRRPPGNSAPRTSFIEMTELGTRIEEMDMVFLAAPLNDSTENLLNVRILQKLQSHAVLVNVGRAKLMDVAEAYRLLRQHRFAGLALDVPMDSSLGFPGGIALEVPNLIISPHLAGRYRGRGNDLELFVERQAARWMSGEKLENLVEF